MKRYLILSFVLLSLAAHSQKKYAAEKGQISFFSDAVVEDIQATNSIVGSLFYPGTGDIVYIVKIRDFIFPKSLMREHFNEKYMESEKYPKSTFQGKITGFKEGVTGDQKVKATGKLTIHGVTRDIEVPGTITLTNGGLTMKAKFMVKLADYNIKIPKIIWQNIAEEIEVRIDFTYKSI